MFFSVLSLFYRILLIKLDWIRKIICPLAKCVESECNSTTAQFPHAPVGHLPLVGY